MAGFADATKYGIETDSGEINGNIYQVACMTWFTASGETMPRYFKFQDDNGDIQIVKEIVVHYVEDKNYSGIPSREYGCEAIINGMRRTFTLIFYLERCKWVMVT